MLTGRGISLLTAAVLTWLIGRTLGIGELYAIAVGCAALVVIGVLYVRQSTSAVSARRLVPRDRVLHGEQLHARLELRNDGRVPSPTLLVAEHLPDNLWADGQAETGPARFVMDSLSPGRVIAFGYAITAEHRGRYTLGPLTLRLRDPFGVAERIRTYTATSDIVVYPPIEALPTGQVRGSHMGTGASDRSRVMSGGEEFFGIREYVSGDDLRTVHWASTAHRQKLMVRQMEQPWQPHATLYLDARRSSHTLGPAGSLERAVSAAASLLYHLADRGYAVRLVTDSDTGRGGPQPWEESLDRLAVLQASGHAGLGPSLGATRGGEGLFAAILGVPPGSGDPAVHPDLRAMFGVRGFGHRLAILAAPASDDGRAARCAALLMGAGWRTAVLNPSELLAPRWLDLIRPPGHGSAPTPSTAAGVPG